MWRKLEIEATWKCGDTAKTKEGQVGKLTMAPDSDGDVKLQWLDGQLSSYVKAATLSRATPAEIRAATRAHTPFTHHLHRHKMQLSSCQASWVCDGCGASGSGACSRYRCASGCDFDLCQSCKTSSAPTWKCGDTAKTKEGRMGKLAMAPDSDGDVKLQWADGSGTSRYTKARELTRATESEFRAAVQAARQEHNEDAARQIMETLRVEVPRLAVFSSRADGATGGCTGVYELDSLSKTRDRNLFATWTMSTGTKVYVLYSDNQDQWAVTVEENVAANKNFMLTERHNALLPHQVEWGKRKAGEGWFQTGAMVHLVASSREVEARLARPPARPPAVRFVSDLIVDLRLCVCEKRCLRFTLVSLARQNRKRSTTP